MQKVSFVGSSCCGSAETNLTSIHKDASLIPDLAQWVKDLALLQATVQVTEVAQIWCCGCGIAAALIQALAQETPYMAGAALKSKKKKKPNMPPTRDRLQGKGHTQIESEGMGKIFQANGSNKKAGVTILISDKRDFTTKAINNDKDNNKRINTRRGYYTH